MDRREAIKRIGMALAGVAVMGTGAASLASCGKKGTKRIIFYFTGTGNCLYVARQIGGDGAMLLSIPQVMKQGELNFEADEIGLVYPIYGHMPPNMVRKFIKRHGLRPSISSPYLPTATVSATPPRYGTTYPVVPAMPSTTSQR